MAVPPEDNIEQILEKLKSIRITPTVLNDEELARLHQMATEDQRRQSLDWILAPLRAKKLSYRLNQVEFRWSSPGSASSWAA